MILYQYKRLAVVEDGTGYKIFDIGNHDKHHTHGIKSFKMCKTICHNVEDHRKPHTRNGYLLESHKRLSNSKKYIDMINRLIEKQKDKQHYVNVQRGLAYG